MKQNTNQEKQAPPAPKGGMSDFRKALLWTAIPIVVLSVLSGVGGWFSGGNMAIIPWALFWLIPAALWLIALVRAIVFTITDRRERAAGIWAGIGIGIIALGSSCFAIVQSE